MENGRLYMYTNNINPVLTGKGIGVAFSPTFLAFIVTLNAKIECALFIPCILFTNVVAMAIYGNSSCKPLLNL